MDGLRNLIACSLIVVVCGCSGAGWREQSQLEEQYSQGPLYTCCNLRPSNGEISDANWYESASLLATPSGALPFGTPVTVTDVGRKSFHLRTDGYGDFTVYHAYGTEPLGNYMKKLLVRDDPKETVRAFPQDIQDAIFEGRVLKGMTKEQVLIAIGYPPTHQTPGVGSNEWTYWTNRWRTYKLQFDRDGRLNRAWGRLPGKFGSTGLATE
jgi:hypothetical protein